MIKSGKWVLFVWLAVFLCVHSANAVVVAEIRCNFKQNPVGVGTTPQFSWILNATTRNQFQSSYRILVSSHPERLQQDMGDLWDSDKIQSDQSLHIRYQGHPLAPGTRYFWKMQVWDKQGHPSCWSNVGHFVTKLFSPADWCGAQWIGLEDIEDANRLVPGVHPWRRDVRNLALRRPVAPLFRKDFQVTKPLQSAYLFISGLGHYQAKVNGEGISQDFLAPGWTDYRKTCLYNTYDVTRELLQGQNALGVIVGPGFYNVNNERYHKLLITYGMPKVIAKLKITYADGTVVNIVSGADWKTTPSPITYSGIYGGESYDARLEQPGWDKAGFQDDAWHRPLLVKPPAGALTPEMAYPIQIREHFSAKLRIKITPDKWLYDFGQNASGFVQITVKGKKGQKVTIRPAELIRDDFTIQQDSSGKPHYYEYTLKGDGIETWRPRFTLYGLRYAQIEGAIPTDQPQDANLPAIVDAQLLHIFNSTPRVGQFHCSNDLFNRINRLIRYAIQSNTQSVLTDCPHREKLGWLEQTFLMGGSIQHNYDMYHLYARTVVNMQDAQHDNGLIPNIAPEFVEFGGDFTDSPEWGSAGIILPWLIYQWYGDTSVMQEAWPMMIRYLDYLKTKAEGDILSHGLGDWYDLGPKGPGYAQLTPKAVTATAIYYFDVKLMARMATLLNKPSEKNSYTQLAATIKSAFNSRFYDPNTGLYATGSQTAMAMPLCLGLVAEENVTRVQQNLIKAINQNNKALTAGDIGFHFLVEALTQANADQLLYEMNKRDDVPGYAYQLKKGATALTESWEALDSKSNNHLMLGHLMQWFYQGLAGIRQQADSVAYKKLTIAPAFLTDFTHVRGSYQCPYGLVCSEWKRLDTGTILMDVTIPVNTTAQVILPASHADRVQEGGQPLAQQDGVTWQQIGDHKLQVQIGSGSYQFTITP